MDFSCDVVIDYVSKELAVRRVPGGKPKVCINKVVSLSAINVVIAI